MEQKWNCLKCKKRNLWGHTVCADCGASKKWRPDWNCPNCQFMVFGSKDRCFRCGIASPTTGPQTRPGDWLCCDCHGINFAKRSHCYICGKERSLSSQVMVYRPLVQTPEPVVTKSPVRQCPICYGEGRSYSLLIPCGHQCCVQCAPRLSTCYQCRSEITESIKIYEV